MKNLFNFELISSSAFIILQNIAGFPYRILPGISLAKFINVKIFFLKITYEIPIYLITNRLSIICGNFIFIFAKIRPFFESKIILRNSYLLSFKNDRYKFKRFCFVWINEKSKFLVKCNSIDSSFEIVFIWTNWWISASKILSFTMHFRS